MPLNFGNSVHQTTTMFSNVDFEDQVEHGYINSNGVKIHYASLGQGPLILMLHGFPDHWYTWRYQMQLLSHNYQVVAIDLRGYNLSDQPKGLENYSMQLLVGDALSVIRQLGHTQAILMGHDWGGAIAWQCAIHAPAVIQKLIILNMPHPCCLTRELAHNPQQQQKSEYTKLFNQPDAYQKLTPKTLSALIATSSPLSETDQEKYLEALQRSDIQSMLHYYQLNYPQEPYTEDPSPIIKVQASVLMIHGIEDQYILADTLNDTWKWLEKDFTLVTVSEAGHFVHYDAPDLVAKAIRCWL
jgi:epoxide hydrolase 4